MTGFRLSERAFASLEAIGIYTEKQWGLAQRDKYLEALDGRFFDLARSPLLGRPRNEVKEGLHSFQEGKHVIFYLIGTGEILIVDIVHERADAVSHMENLN